MKLTMELGHSGYDITVERGSLDRAAELLRLNRRVLVVSEPGVPAEYAARLLAQCPQGQGHLFAGGEEGKSLREVEGVLAALARHGFTRGDCVVAVGGGVTGDLAGFAASCYMRGIDFYNLPTTLLSQIASSIGGKTGVNFGGVKNLVGAFHQPKGVLIDPDLLSTLPKRQIASGLAEAVKMAMTFDEELLSLLERTSPEDDLTEIIYRSLQIKKMVVEQDEKEQGLRRVLNFGHTLGHGIEGLGTGLYHGECVALGMLPMCTDVSLRRRLAAILARLGLPLTPPDRIDEVMALVMHDKKRQASGVLCVRCDKAGSYRMEQMDESALRRAYEEGFAL